MRKPSGGPGTRRLAQFHAKCGQLWFDAIDRDGQCVQATPQIQHRRLRDVHELAIDPQLHSGTFGKRERDLSRSKDFQLGPQDFAREIGGPILAAAFAPLILRME